MPVLEQTTKDSMQPQMDSSKGSPLLPQKQQTADPVNTLAEAESEEELLEVLTGVVISCHEVSQLPQLKLEGMGSRTDPVHSAVPRGGVVNQTLSPKPPDLHGSVVRDKASEEDLKENFQKIPNPSKVGDFRPISCCNTVYKCIARIFSKRLQVALPVLIDLALSRFVKGRRIADNIFLTQEPMRGYHKSSSSPRCAMKVDIRKAYDNVIWEFLWDVLSSMNFHPTMIKWLQACVTTANYTLSLNGETTGLLLLRFVAVMSSRDQLLCSSALPHGCFFCWLLSSADELSGGCYWSATSCLSGMLQVDV
ncbi:hypothetical protein RHSIM_Rhsim08G0140200 [Rhododendron simsii]|uniref:Reverse transcriptase domain-containing protein n=1 Tax=Rhododendron simsii TaxID=118357 RepID=A0A834LDB1_RHOSS|nr:hypothetical protein RHSIM_Rhsim08G0140200 [Rhododendron simsii]